MSQLRPVLYADDDPDDRNWIMEACKKIQFSFQIHFVENGIEAMEYLNNSALPQLPSLIVLDLNMPALDGRQTLKKIKSHEHFKNIPVIIVTTSSNKTDIEVCKVLGASLYLIKPDTYHEWQSIVLQFIPFLS